LLTYGFHLPPVQPNFETVPAIIGHWKRVEVKSLGYYEEDIDGKVTRGHHVQDVRFYRRSNSNKAVVQEQLD